MASAALALAPAPAAAATFEVNSTDDPGDGMCQDSGPDGGCTLREAILAANASSGADRIEFDFAGNDTVTIRPKAPLPDITDAVTIDGTTHDADDPDVKGIELDGSDAGSSDGLRVTEGPATILGLAINGFAEGAGVVLLDDDNTVSGNHIGTDAAGDEAKPNGSGVVVLSAGNTIGGTSDDARNVISGNEGVGVFLGVLGDGGGGDGVLVVAGSRTRDEPRDERGEEEEEEEDEDDGKGKDDEEDEDGDEGGGDTPTDEVLDTAGDLGAELSRLIASSNEVFGNHIGTDAEGSGDVGNGGPGVIVDQASVTNLIGGDSDGEGNRIAFNGTGAEAGVVVQGLSLGTKILRNSIWSNSGLGIDLGGDGPTGNDPLDIDTGANNLQNSPVLDSAQTEGGSTTVEGELESTPSTTFRVEFFADESCASSDAAEGREFLGAADVTTGVDGTADISPAVSSPDSDHDAITATATNTVTGDTSEFSNCVEPDGGRDGGGPGGGGSNGGGSNGNGNGDGDGDGDDDRQDQSTSTQGTGLIASLVAGPVYIKVPGSASYRPLLADEVVQFGSSVNANNGRVRVAGIDRFGQPYSSEFFGGTFVLTQAGAVAAQAGRALPTIDIRLIGGDFSSCRPTPRRAARQAQVRRPPRRLWGSGRGRFRTQGRYGAATVRGTVWLTEDRCNGTLFVVREGVLAVFDRALRRTVTVRAGHSYLARSRRPR